MVEPGSMPLQPTRGRDFRAHHGQQSTAQILFRGLGRMLDRITGTGSQNVLQIVCTSVLRTL